MHHFLFAPLVFDNSTTAWLSALGIMVFVTALFRGLNGAISRRLASIAPSTDSLVDDLLLDVLRRTSFLFQAAVGAFCGAQFVSLSDDAETDLRRTMVLVLLLQVGRWGTGIVRHLIVMVVDQRLSPGDQSQRSGRNLLQSFGISAVWGLVALMALQTFDVQITPLVTGLGVTTVVVGLAAQQIGSDLLASASIILDKSFLVGDFVIVDQMYLGTIERIGIIKTLVRSLSGEEIIFSNNDLLKSRVRNFRTLTERRILFDFFVEHETSAAALQDLATALASIVKQTPLTRFDRAHWAAFAEHGLRMEVVYYVLSNDYTHYMDAQQAINFGILRYLEERKIRLAIGMAIRTRFTGQVPALADGLAQAAAATARAVEAAGLHRS